MARAEMHREETLEGRLLLWATDWVTLVLLTAGLIFPCLSACGISGHPGFDLGAVLAFCVFGSLAVSVLYTWQRWYWGLLAALGLGGLIFWRMWAHMAEDWTRVRSPNLTDLLEAAPDALFLLYALGALALGWITVRARAWYLAAALVTLPVIPTIIGGTLPAWPGMLAGFIGWASLLLTSLYSRRDTDSLGRARLVSLGGVAVMVLILVMALPMEGYSRPQWATHARENLIRGVTRQLDRFFDDDTAASELLTSLGLDLSIPQEIPRSNGGWGGEDEDSAGGLSAQRENLLAVGPRRDSDRLILSLRTNQPNPAGRIYLRGVTFQTYTGSSWEREEEQPLFQPGLYPALTAPDIPEYTLRIRDIAFRGIWYTPYRFTGGGEMDANGNLTGVQQTEYLMPSEGQALGSAESYAITYRPGGPENGFLPLADPWAAEESRYRGEALYQYGICLRVPPELEELLMPLLPELDQEPVVADSRLPEQFQEPVAAAVRTARWLANRASYDPDTPAMEPGEDFVARFLLENRGYCVHFATAGAILLRLQGIPARYVTGYVANLSATGQAQVRGDGAHAWVEIYLDGYGWYPVEMTPGYSGGVSGVSLEGGTEVPDPTAEPEEEPDEIPEEEFPEEETPEETAPEEDAPLLPGDLSEEDGEESHFPWLRVLFTLALAWAVVCAAYLLGQLVRRQTRADKNLSRSALRAYRRYRLLLRLLGGSEDGTMEFLARKAKFSRSGLTAQEHEAVWRHLDQAVQDAKDRRPARKRWIVALLQPIF